MARTEFGRYNIIAAFADFTAAQRAVEAVKDVGLRADDVSLLGKQGETVVSDDTRTQDPSAVSSTLKGTVAGAVGGGVLGGVAGFLIGLAALAVPGVGPVITAGVWAAAAGGALFGAQGGGFIGAMTGASMSKARAEAYHTYLTQGRVLVGVHTDDRAQFDRALGVLVELQPVDLDRFGPGLDASVEGQHA